MGERHAPGWFLEAINWIARSLEAVGVLVVAAAAVVASVSFVIHFCRHGWSLDLYHQYRSQLGRGILVGLEFMVGADIIETVTVAPTMQSALVLGLIVLIRTFLSFSLEVEIDGRWPWKEAEARRAARATPGAEPPGSGRSGA